MSGEEIIRLYRSGDRERAFNELVSSYSEKLYWHVRSLTGSHEDTDDLLQDIFIKIWTALPSYRGEAQLYTWLYRIATNETLNFLRKKKLLSLLSLDALETAAENMASGDSFFDGDKAEAKLCSAIMKLPPRQRAVFVMRYYDEMPYEQISEILGASVSSLKASYHFAQEKIKLSIESSVK